MPKVILDNVSVKFPTHLDERGKSLGYRIAQLFSFSNQYKNYYDALANLSLTARVGDRIGIIGANGAGKTTLLRTIAGIYEPQIGRVYKFGRTISLINLTMGMDVYATGIENIRRRALLYGIAQEKIPDLIEDVTEFAALGEFIDRPIRTYSSGMVARLAFGIATAVDADIILMDEWLSTGDSRFIENAQKRMKGLLTEEKIVFLATHSAPLVRDWCNKLLVLHKGRKEYFGPDLERGLKIQQHLIHG